MKKQKPWKQLLSMLCITSLVGNMMCFPVQAKTESRSTVKQDILQDISEEKEQPTAQDASYDPRSLGILPPVRSQGSYGTCWVHAVSALIEISMIRKGIQTPENANVSELHMSYFRYNFTPDPLGGTEGDFITETDTSVLFSGIGSSANTIHQLAAWMGPVAEEKYPYSEAYRVNEILQNTKEHAYAEKAALLYETATLPYQDIAAMKEAIVKYGAVGMTYYSNWSTAYENGETYGRYCPSYKSPNHAVAIVGWDDNFSKEKFGNMKPEKDGAWLVRNSYGSYQFDGGYFWLSYEDKTMGSAYYIDVVAPDTYDNNYQYDNNVTGNEIISSGNNPKIYAANIFTTHASPDKQEDLVAVSFDTPYPNLNYSIQIYKDLADATDPTSGVAVLDQPLTGEKLLAGRFTRDLPKAIALNQEETFAVVIEFTHAEEGSTPALSLENNTTSSKVGQSLYSLDGGNWTDLGELGKGNLRIKAFTKNTERPEELLPEQEPEKEPEKEPEQEPEQEPEKVPEKEPEQEPEKVPEEKPEQEQNTDKNESSSPIIQKKKYTVNNIIYRIKNSTAKTVEVIGLKKNKNTVKIPATVKIEGKVYRVTAILPTAFRNNKKLKNIKIQANLKEIPEKAFSGCINLKEVSISSKNLLQIETGAFVNCKKLTKITVDSKKLKKIGTQTFYNCRSLRKITLKTTALKQVGNKAFRNIHKKAVIQIPRKKAKAYRKYWQKLSVKYV